MSRAKVTYIVSDVDKALAFEWIVTDLRNRFDLYFILIGQRDTNFSEFLKGRQIRYTEVTDLAQPGTIRKWLTILNLLRKERPHVVHTHLWRANLLGITASWVARIPKRIYTRHHALVHYNEHPAGRKWDLLVNRLSTHIVAISQNTKEILVNKDRADPSKITVIHHGFDLKYFREVDEDRVAAVALRYGIDRDAFPLIGVVARHLEWKGIHYIVPAFAKLLHEFPSARIVLANAAGNYSEVIQQQLSELPTGSWVNIRFEEDQAALYRLFHVYVHTPVDGESEAFGQTYVEALASGVPSVFTLSGVAREFISDEKNALVVPFRNSEAIHSAVRRLLNDSKLRANLSSNGRISANLFPLSNMTESLAGLYA